MPDPLALARGVFNGLALTALVAVFIAALVRVF